jgi:riboflavin synthase
MFTGIIQDLGRVRALEPLAEGLRLVLATALPVDAIELGESITVNGACMTVVATEEGAFAVDVSAESLRRTTLGELAVGDPVNLERSMRADTLMGGHMVSGHVDGTGAVLAVRPEGESRVFTFSLPAEMAALMVEKGSIAVDGISLTCYACGPDRFDVAVIPHTLAVTTLGSRNPGDRVNLENDMLGKYVAKLVDAAVDARLGRLGSD